jgi:hypothetical protein
MKNSYNPFQNGHFWPVPTENNYQKKIAEITKKNHPCNILIFDNAALTSYGNVCFIFCNAFAEKEHKCY